MIKKKEIQTFGSKWFTGLLVKSMNMYDSINFAEAKFED